MLWGKIDIPPSLIIYGAYEIADPLTTLLNHCLKKATFPTTEKVAQDTSVNWREGQHLSTVNSSHFSQTF